MRATTETKQRKEFSKWVNDNGLTLDDVSFYVFPYPFIIMRTDRCKFIVAMMS